MRLAGNYRCSVTLEAIGDRVGRFRRLLVFALFLPAACPGVARAGEYVVGIDSGFARLRVSACFDAPVPAALFASYAHAPEYLVEIRVNGHDVPVGTAAGGRLSLGGADRGCLEYAVDARAAGRALRFPNVGGPGTGSVLLDPGDWLWLPDVRVAQVHTLSFDLPEGMEVSAPWPPAGPRQFRLEGFMREWSSLVAIGRLDADRIALPGSELRLALLPGVPAADRHFVRDWIRRGAQAITTIYGSFPVPAPQILVVPVGSAREAVPWGQVQRGGGAAAHLFIDQTRPIAEFADDWVLVHELSHFVHPNLGAGSAWLSEGLATYYQYVSRARAGMLTEHAAWQKLHEGFERGRGQTRAGVDLIEATRTMRERRIFMRVYWTGTALMLLADLALRDAGSSLDEALRRFRDCCLAESREWETGEFLERLDRLTGTDVMSRLARKHVHSDRFPDLETAYARLDLRHAGRRIQPGPGAAGSELRRAIMAPRN